MTVLSLAGATSASAADFAADFTPGLANPNGNWSYGYIPGSGPMTFTSFGEYYDDGNVFGWRTNLSLGVPAAFKVRTSSFAGVDPGEAALHGGPGGEIAVARWTAPAGTSGLHHIAGTFGAGDASDVDLYITLNGNWQFFRLHTYDDEPFSLNLPLTAGDVVDFQVGIAVSPGGGSYLGDSTPLFATITAPVPEPATMAVFGFGLAALTRRRRRR